MTINVEYIEEEYISNWWWINGKYTTTKGAGWEQVNA